MSTCVASSRHDTVLAPLISAIIALIQSSESFKVILKTQLNSVKNFTSTKKYDLNNMIGHTLNGFLGFLVKIYGQICGAWKLLVNWVVVLDIFLCFTPKIGEDEPILTNIFQRGWWKTTN